MLENWMFFKIQSILIVARHHEKQAGIKPSKRAGCKSYIWIMPTITRKSSQVYDFENGNNVAQFEKGFRTSNA